MAGLFTYRKFSLQETPSLEGQVAVVTGGQAGIGKGKPECIPKFFDRYRRNHSRFMSLLYHLEITAQLLIHGIEKVVIVARSEDKFNSACDEWKARVRIGISKDDQRVAFVKCDLGNMDDVYVAAQQIKQQTECIHILVCNAGLGIQPIAPLNSQGIDPIFATNYIGHHMLTTLLLPLLKNATPTAPFGCRVLVASSSLHKLCCDLNLSSLTRPSYKWPSLHDAVWRYARSKLGNILFAKEFSRRLLEENDPAARQIYVNSYFPGNVVTQQWQGWSEHLGDCIGTLIRWLGRRFGQSVEEAATTAMFLASSPDVSNCDSRGRYYVPIAKADEPNELGRNEALGRDLWEWVDARVTQT
ncbi:hypothetical protein N7451_012146 [Penicillium sp. IBT 35674x]|nr:hypothetical protein N7451_012146 [Penicillium sp. IBT 35674x]